MEFTNGSDHTDSTALVLRTQTLHMVSVSVPLGLL